MSRNRHSRFSRDQPLLNQTAIGLSAGDRLSGQGMPTMCFTDVVQALRSGAGGAGEAYHLAFCRLVGKSGLAKMMLCAYSRHPHLAS